MAGTAEVLAGREVTPRALNQMVSLRLEPQLLRSLRLIAEREGTSVSDVLRQAAAAFVSQWQQATFRLSTEVSSTVQTTVVGWSQGSQTSVGGVLSTTRKVA